MNMSILVNLPFRSDGKEAIVLVGQASAARWTYTQLANYVNQLAHGLKEMGVAQGERVALLAKVSCESIAVSLGVIRVGAITMEIRKRTGTELKEEDIPQLETVRDLLQQVVKQSESKEAVPQTFPFEQPEDALHNCMIRMGASI